MFDCSKKEIIVSNKVHQTEIKQSSLNKQKKTDKKFDINSDMNIKFKISLFGYNLSLKQFMSVNLNELYQDKEGLYLTIVGKSEICGVFVNVHKENKLLKDFEIGLSKILYRDQSENFFQFINYTFFDKFQIYVFMFKNLISKGYEFLSYSISHKSIKIFSFKPNDHVSPSILNI